MWYGLHDLPVDARQRWAAARVWATRQAPYLSSALLALEPVVIAEAPAGADLSAFPVDAAWHVYVEAEVIEATDVPTVGFWLIHQVSHLLRRHAERYPLAGTDNSAADLYERSFGQRRWNASTDAEIDDDLFAGELTLPDVAITPSWIGYPEGWVAEQYWDALGARGTRQHPDDLPPSADCGSGCDGRQRAWDCRRPGLSDTGRKLVAREVARRIREHSRQRGDVPAGWQRWADEVLEPAVSWQRVLASALRRGVADVAGRVDFTYQRPSRRASAVPDVVLPSLRQPLPQVAMVLDTSWSMSDQMLGQALAEVAGVLRGIGVGRRHLRVLCCDAEAYEAQRVVDAREVRLVGGGGTNMSEGIRAAVGLKPRPDLVVVLTDGHTSWPATPPPGVRVVVGLMDHHGNVPDWATTVFLGPGGTLAGS